MRRESRLHTHTVFHIKQTVIDTKLSTDTQQRKQLFASLILNFSLIFQILLQMMSDLGDGLPVPAP